MNKKQRHGKVRAVNAHQESVQQARQKWLGKTVQFDLHRGLGVQLGEVTSISSDGTVVVECLAGYDAVVPALMMSLGFVEQTLTLVDE